MCRRKLKYSEAPFRQQRSILTKKLAFSSHGRRPSPATTPHHCRSLVHGPHSVHPWMILSVDPLVNRFQVEHDLFSFPLLAGFYEFADFFFSFFGLFFSFTATEELTYKYVFHPCCPAHAWALGVQISLVAILLLVKCREIIIHSPKI